jgi:hypothetical protein
MSHVPEETGSIAEARKGGRSGENGSFRVAFRPFRNLAFFEFANLPINLADEAVVQ